MSGKISSIRTQTADVTENKTCPYCGNVGLVKTSKWSGYKCVSCQMHTQNPIGD